ncbi:trichohyalin isoform X2 [Antennarius striatus]|uniref:trichohyalin isoform X2 n=1 Tax=Antennarius striatus TaxID=241820 RepID=UPI0035AFEBBB
MGTSTLLLHSSGIFSLSKILLNNPVRNSTATSPRHFQTSTEEVHRLRERERDVDELRRGQSPGEERRMEQWKREVGRELSSLRGHITRATSLGNLEESFSSKHREELEVLRRELDQLKTRLRRQEEDSYLHQAEARETRRRCQHNYKTLDELRDGYRTNNTDLTKTVSQCLHTQEEVCQMRTAVSELKEEMRRLILRKHDPTTVRSAHTSGASPLPRSHSRGVRGDEVDSDSEDFSPTPSLAEVSSDDLSWLEDREPAPHQPPVRLSVQSRRSDFAGPGSDLEEDDDDDDDDNDNYLNPDLGSDLSLGDL